MQEQFITASDPLTVLVPLCARDGSTPGYVIIDASDAEFVNQWSWYLNTDGYAVRIERHNKVLTTIRLHRELLGLVPGDGLEGDHINRNRLDCRRSNLRVTQRIGNRQNKPSYQGSSSSYRGVTWSKTARKWAAQVQANGKHVHLGHFDDEIEAAKAAKDGRLRLLPFSVD